MRAIRLGHQFQGSIISLCRLGIFIGAAIDAAERHPDRIVCRITGDDSAQLLNRFLAAFQPLQVNRNFRIGMNAQGRGGRNLAIGRVGQFIVARCRKNITQQGQHDGLVIAEVKRQLGKQQGRVDALVIIHGCREGKQGFAGPCWWRGNQAHGFFSRSHALQGSLDKIVAFTACQKCFIDLAGFLGTIVALEKTAISLGDAQT